VEQCVTNQDETILDELKKITKLLSLLATRGLTQRDQIAALARVGFGPKQIADLLGTTSNTVSVYLHGLRRQAKQGRQTKEHES
jgi:DNA-binding CsgD family transcriptional regulator